MHRPLIQHNSWQIKKQSEIWRNTINLTQTLTFRLNINEWFKYEKGANLVNNPCPPPSHTQTHMHIHTHTKTKILTSTPSKGFSKIFNSFHLPSWREGACHVLWWNLIRMYFMYYALSTMSEKLNTNQYKCQHAR